MAKAPKSLAGQIVAITGGARGIGRATAAALIAQGARVAIGDIDAELATATAGELGAGTIGLELDVTRSDSFAAFLDQVEAQLGPLDVLINNAGIMPIGAFVDETEATAQRMIDINLHGVITGSKLAIERFLPRRRGHLVQIASAAGKFGIAGGATYCATKHAVVGLSEALAMELRGTGIDISVVMPTVVNTELGSGLPQTRAFKAVEPAEVANAIVEALQTGRFDVFVPKSLNATSRMTALMPRKVAQTVGHLLKSDQVLANPDHLKRAAYEARMTSTISGPAVAAAPPAAPAPSRAPEPATVEPDPANTADPAGNGSADSEPASVTG